jgi:hypothetical protein
MGLAARTFGQNDGGNENGKCDGEHANRLVRDSCQFIWRDLFIPQIYADRYEAKKILCVNRSTNADPRDIWIGGKAFVEFHGATGTGSLKRRAVDRQHGVMSCHPGHCKSLGRM